MDYINYFKIIGDRHAFFYEFKTSPYNDPPIKSTTEFGNDKHKITLIDQFCGKRPMMYSADFMKEPVNYPLTIVPTVILDSNIATYLHPKSSDKGWIDNYS
jgi:hypothetical protein